MSKTKLRRRERAEKSLWDIAIDQTKLTEDPNNAEENSILFLGSKNAGKTSIILRFLDREEPPKPTVALEYTFGRRAKGHNLAKDVGHIWELGGGTWLSKLIDIPLNPDTISTTSAVIVLDLSSPNELWFTLETLIKTLKARVQAVINECHGGEPDVKEALRRAAWERVGADHQDKELMDPFLIPLVIIGGKYDQFQEFDSEKRKIICKTLRFVAHVYGAHLQFFSTKQEALMTRAKAVVSHCLFKTSPSKNISVDHNKPLLVPFGQDSLAQIGNPPLPEGDIGRVTARMQGPFYENLRRLDMNPIELWKVAFTSVFPQENISDPSQVEDPAKDAQYKEVAVDQMRAQKDEELERYRRLCERRAKEAQQMAMAGGV